MWASTPIGQTAIHSCPTTDRNATRNCTEGGVWEEPYVDDCICTEENKTTSGITLMWASTPIGQTAIHSCPNTEGNATRNCTVGGVWEEPYVDDCICTEETKTTSGITLMWASTPIGQTAIHSCPTTDRNATRNCTEGGVWEEPNVEECTCPEDTNTQSGITLTWPPTPIGTIATLSCPNTEGNATRNCTVRGVWEQPYVEECTCPEDTNTLTWPPTPIGTIATLSCPNNEGNATRNCTVGGVWEQPYVEECTCPEETNTTSGITLTWPPTPIGTIATLSCPNNEGNATRNCTVGGVWEQPYVEECTCPEETNTQSGITLTWPPTPIGTIATLSCPNTEGNATRNCTVGGVWEQPYVEGCTCPEDTNTQSGITLAWPPTPIGTIATLSCPNTEGNATRNCTVGGVWEQPYVEECTCPEETNTQSGITLTWPPNPIGTIATLSCPNTEGNATRNCTVGGVWEQPYVEECTCPEDTNTLTWPPTPIGTIATLSCPNTEGNATRNCTVGGVWEQPYVEECTCPEETNTTSGITLTWPPTPIGTIATLSCPNNEGNATRNCTVRGVWEQPYVEECTCPEDTNTLTWPPTPIGTIATLSCPNTEGNATRNCTVGGVWEQPYVEECTCPEETNTTSGITLTWPPTPIGTIATLSCPNTEGNATRNCTVRGVWEQPYVEECTCPEDTNTLTWPPTPIGTIATLSCPNTEGNATRNCTVGGVWEQPYVEECTCPEETNTTSGITLTWPPTPIGTIATLSCPNTEGNATRNCTVRGVWEQPYVEECTCPEDTNTLTWPPTPIGTIATLSCPNNEGNATRNCTVGGVWEQPYVEECTCPEDTNTQSGITLTWPPTPIGTIATLSCPNTEGNATRNCTVRGVWEQPYVEECTCPEDTNTQSGITLTWPPTPIGTIATLSCPNTEGNATRNCTVGGVWEQPYVEECTCPEDTNTQSGITLTWPPTPIGTIATLSCPNTEGNATRNCTVGGVWEQPYVEECTCPEETNTQSGITLTWPPTPIGTIATLSCPNTEGNATRNCTVGGVWEQPYVEECTCPEETNTLTWPPTPIGTIATLSCPNNEGNATRNCTVGGVWEQPYVEECTCPEETNTTSGITLTWPPTPIGTIATLSCPNTEGNATRNCTVRGVWEQPYVEECTCPEDTNTLTWPPTPIGTITTLSCPNNEGNATRNCTVGGVWEQPYVEECTCPEETNTTSGITLTWPPTPIGTIATIACPNTEGNATRNCTVRGVWEQPYVEECTCPEDTNTLTWPPTPIGTIATLSCPNTEGNATRNCTVGGVWEQPYVEECTCPEETNTTSGITLTWPPTPIGTIVTLSCPNTEGSATRNCTVRGVWEQPYVEECTCLEDTYTQLGITLTWPSTPVGTIATLSCPNTEGNATRNCTVGGVWEQPYVEECTCPEDTNTLTWPPTPIGTIATLSCPNTEGNATRNCTVGGVWEQPYVRNCFTCPLETNNTSGVTLTWTLTPAGGISVLSCPSTDGSATRNCSEEGVWEQPFVCDCLTQRISQQLCNVCDSIHSLCTVVVLMLLVSSLPCV